LARAHSQNEQYGTTASVQVFGRRNNGLSTHSDGRRPKSRQGRKSRVGNGGGAATMGISPRAQASMWRNEAARYAILPVNGSRIV
jgi:hypothetical protein